ncbi:MAG: hypothetical protein WED04_08250 [Promethearchaeati archaeon SRVP18_Atabeyarchaeia-1]
MFTLLTEAPLKGVGFLAIETVIPAESRVVVEEPSRNTIFECGDGGLRVDRHLNEAINLYLRMVDVPQNNARWDRIVYRLSLLWVGTSRREWSGRVSMN